MGQDDIRKRIRDTWRDRPEGTLCVEVLGWLTRAAQPLAEVTITRLRIAALALGVESEDAEAVAVGALTFLCGAHVHLLDVRFDLRDPEGCAYPLDTSVVSAAERNGSLLHPVTGLPVDDWKSHVFLNFPASDLARTLARAPTFARSSRIPRPHEGSLP
jgi:hypothetical protein